MKKSQIFLTSFLALPLSFVGIPIYLNIAEFYSNQFHLSLVKIGLMLAIIRIFDAVQDPFVGHYSDLLCSKKITRKKLIFFCSSLLCLGFFLTFNPPTQLSQNSAAFWFFASLALTYSCFNFVVINFEAMIALISKNDQERISLNSAKEFLGLIGMIFAFLIPEIISKIFNNSQANYFYLSLVFVILTFFSALALPEKSLNNFSNKSTKKLADFKAIFHDKKFLNFLLIFFLNSIAVSLPAANLNFYVGDVLGAKDRIAWFLCIYFISACLFIPLWRYFFNKVGVIKSWLFSISGAVATFSFAYFLNDQSANYFYLVCLLSGAFLGSDLIAVPTILSQITKNNPDSTATYFSLWNFLGKIGLMIAASGSLIILGFFGYKSGNSATFNLSNIKFFYALLPCILKLTVIWLLTKFQKYEN